MKRWPVIIIVYLFYAINLTIANSINSTLSSNRSDDILSEYCWNETESCNIIGNFTRKKIGLSFPVHINCLETNFVPATTATTQQLSPHMLKTLLPPRFNGIEVILLNGCGVNNRERNFFGLEYIPDAESVIQLSLEMFKIDNQLKNDTFKDFKKLETLILVNNELLSGINRTTLKGLDRLKKLTLEDNALRAIDEHAFEHCSSSLKHLTIIEDVLSLNNWSMLNNITFADLSVKQLNWKFFLTQLQSLEYLRISRTRILNIKANVNENFTNLSELHLVSSNLTELPSNKYPNLILLNVSLNHLQSVSLEQNNLMLLQKLDMNYNNLTSIDEHLLATLLHLEVFTASHNKITIIKRKAFNRNLYMRLINLSNNHLKVLNLDAAIFLTAPHLKILIDDNPWSCVWVINFSANEPYLFTTKFIYTKFSDRVNMRGLKCQFYANDEMVLQHHYHLLDDTHLHHNHSTMMPMLPASPVEVTRRNTKHTAVITIVILVVGVTSLLLVLYVHIKCRPMTSSLQSPFYRTLPTNHCSGDRVDIVRRILPPTDYESPLSERMKMSAESINELRPDNDTSLFTDIDLKDLYEEIPEKRDDGNHLYLDDFSYRLTNTEHALDMDNLRDDH